MGGHRAEGEFLRWRDPDTDTYACEGQRANQQKPGEQRGVVQTRRRGVTDVFPESRRKGGRVRSYDSK